MDILSHKMDSLHCWFAIVWSVLTKDGHNEEYPFHSLKGIHVFHMRTLRLPAMAVSELGCK